MFYSHEILTSPEHGVATIWLVATLGSRSIARRLNRKAILDVDVPNACRVIINPEAPMALRLQGSLLYGVSRVYNQQCGYTLLDTQTMHDKMVSMLKIIPGSGLDPSAGQTKPSNLVLPYDQSFMPETNLPGLDIDLSYFAPTDEASSQISSLWTKSPINSLSDVSQLSSLQIEFQSDDMGEGTFMGFEDIGSERKDLLHRVAGLGVEQGVLLQPDFEFDEDGNLVELDGRARTPHLGQKSTAVVRESDGLFERETEDGKPRNDRMPMDNGAVDFVDNDIELDNRVTEPNVLQTNEGMEGVEETIEIRSVRTRRTRRPKEIISDDATALRNMTLAQWNNEYVANMTLASKQKQQNKMQTIAKKNAAFWVFRQGIGSVGIGIGTQQEPHPLSIFSGEDLFESIGGYIQQKGHKRTLDDDDTNTERRVRAREEGRDHLSRENINRLNMEVEVGRDAPSSLIDDHSQMPWNINSINSSRVHRLGSVEMSSQHKARSCLTSASPLTGRGYLDHTTLSAELAFGDDLDLTRYLEGELATDREHISSLSVSPKRLERAKEGLDRESLNFFEFIKSQMGIDESLSLDLSSGLSGKLGRTTFAALMPYESTTRAVATQALMNVLTLATKGVLCVHQDRFRTDSGGYCSGEIQLRFSV